MAIHQTNLFLLVCLVLLLEPNTYQYSRSHLQHILRQHTWHLLATHHHPPGIAGFQRQHLHLYRYRSMRCHPHPHTSRKHTALQSTADIPQHNRRQTQHQYTEQHNQLQVSQEAKPAPSHPVLESVAKYQSFPTGTLVTSSARSNAASTSSKALSSRGKSLGASPNLSPCEPTAA
jgi:Protein of unknown function (DUF2550)